MIVTGSEQASVPPPECGGAPRCGSQGLTLIETLVAMALLSVAVMSILPAVMTQLDSDTRNAVRLGGVGAVQIRMEALRLQDPATMPSSGSSAVQVIMVGDRAYQVTTRFCLQPTLCNASSRHVTVEARFDSTLVYDAQTVYTQLL